MTAIVLWGKGGTGKTSTLKAVIKNLLDQGAIIVQDCTKDRRDDLCLILKFNGKKIAISTDGDCKSIVKANFKDLDETKEPYDLFIGASHSWGETCKGIKDRFSNPDDKILWYRVGGIDASGFSETFLESTVYTLVHNHQTDCIVELIKSVL